MKKTALVVSLALVALVAFGCSNWNRMTPGNLDNRAIQAEIEKNVAEDGMTGVVHVDSVSGGGIVTLSGTLKNCSDRSKALDDARKVNGVTQVIDNLKC